MDVTGKIIQFILVVLLVYAAIRLVFPFTILLLQLAVAIVNTFIRILGTV